MRTALFLFIDFLYELGWMLLALGLLVGVGLLFWNPLGFQFSGVLGLFVDLIPIWLPITLLFVFWSLWMEYIRAQFIKEQGSILLEVRLPQEIVRSPRAMELVFTTLYQTGGPTYIDTYWGGKVKPWFSFELVSIGGDIHFYIWTQPKYRHMIETTIYAQYPNVEIHEAEDYTRDVKHDSVHEVQWGTYFILTKPDWYPIKTYVDYGLDKDPKEELKIEPMSSMLEYLGSLKPGEQAWIQILIQAHKEEKIKEGYLFKKKFWKEGAMKEVSKLLSRDPKTKLSSTKIGDLPVSPVLTDEEKKTADAITRSLEKIPFECAIRGFYISKMESFNSINIPGLIGSFRQYSSNTLNGFRIGWYTDFDYPWQDFKRVRRNQIERQMLDAYKRRSFFHAPYRYFHQKPIILTTEELATIYHFPGEIVQTPTLRRTASRKGEAPPNLPVS